MRSTGRGSGVKAQDYAEVISGLSGYYSAEGVLTALGNLVSLEDPFRVLIATVLSQRTRDDVTERAEKALFVRYRDARSLARAHIRDLEYIIRGVGFYRTKARAIREIARLVLEKHNGKVPRNIDALLSLPHVGRKTANCVLVFGFGEPAIPVDTHVHRISNRIGWVRTRTPEETEMALSSTLPRKYWLDLNELFVLHGQHICRPVSPRCSICPVARYCRWNKCHR